MWKYTNQKGQMQLLRTKYLVDSAYSCCKPARPSDVQCQTLQCDKRQGSRQITQNGSGETPGSLVGAPHAVTVFGLRPSYFVSLASPSEPAPAPLSGAHRFPPFTLFLVKGLAGAARPHVLALALVDPKYENTTGTREIVGHERKGLRLSYVVIGWRCLA